MKSVLFIVALSFASAAPAAWAEDFQSLKIIPRSFKVSGNICEEVARLDQIKKFPLNQYDVVTGVSYGTVNQVVGEMDVVVFEKATGKAVQVTEVKCWKDLADGLDKAYSQRDRFLKALWSGKKLVFKSTTTNQIYHEDAFENIEEFLTLGQKGAIAAGYDQELQYSLSEMHQHTQDMINCQDQGLCARP